MNTDDAKLAIYDLYRHGLEAINFTGGEPLLRKDIDNLIKFSKRLGLKTILTTNGILLEMHLKNIFRYVDFIGLPLESVDPGIHNRMRPSLSNFDNHSQILRLIALIKKQYPRIGIKINTLVSRQNIKEIAMIGSLIEGSVVSWKLSQFIPSNFGSEHREDFAVSKKEFSKAVKLCKSLYPKMNIIATPAYSRQKGCRILSSNGHLLRPVHNTLKDLGPVCFEKKIFKGYDDEMSRYFLEKTYPRGDKE